MNGHNEVQTSKDRAEPQDKHTKENRNNTTEFSLRGIRRVESPTGIKASQQQGQHRKECPCHP